VADYTIRPYEPGDETSILELFERAFHHRRDVAHWRWKYRDAPGGALRISVAVDGEGRVVTHYAGYPVAFHRAAAGEPEILVGHQIGDTMTHPDARGVGRRSTSLLARTAGHFYAHFCAGRVAFNYGFNEGGVRRFSIRSLNAELVEPVSLRVRERSAGPDPAPGPRRRLLGGLTAEPVAAVDQTWDTFFDAVAPAYGFLVRRDARYLRWRYLGRPDVPYLVLAVRRRDRLVGWGVFARRERMLVWGDALVHPEHRDAVEILRDAAAADPIAHGTEGILGWFPPRPAWFAAVLDDLGFRTEAEPQDLGLMCVPWLAPDAAASMRRVLYYTYGDGDLF
jgi:hypothetical protein